MKRFRMMSLACAAVALFVVGRLGYNTWWLNSPPSSPRVQLAVPEDLLDLGTVWETDAYDLTLPIENLESFPVTVEKFGSSCTCISINPDSFTIDPGGRRDVQLKLDLTAKKDWDAKDETTVRLWPIVKVGPEGGDRRGPEWMIHARCRRAFTVPGSTFLGRCSELAQPIPPQNIPITVLVPLESLTATCDLAGFATSIETISEKSRLLRLTATSSLPVGAFKGMVILRPALAGGNLLPIRRIRFNGTIVSDVELDPLAVQVGGRHLKESFEELVSLRSLTKKVVTVICVEADGEGLFVTPEGGQRYRVRQVVCQPGTQLNHVRFTVESGGNHSTVELPVVYTGLSPDVAN